MASGVYCIHGSSFLSAKNYSEALDIVMADPDPIPNGSVPQVGEITLQLRHLERFRAHLPIDCVLLLGYGCFGYLLASHTALFAGHPAALRRAAIWALPLAAAFDAAENALHEWLTAVPRFGVTLPYAAVALCSIAKWTLIAGFAIGVAQRSRDPRTDPLRARWLATAVLLAALGSSTWAQPSSPTAPEIAPAGRLRVALQVASPILAQRAADGSVGGVTGGGS